MGINVRKLQAILMSWLQLSEKSSVFHENGGSLCFTLWASSFQRWLNMNWISDSQLRASNHLMSSVYPSLSSSGNRWTKELRKTLPSDILLQILRDLKLFPGVFLLVGCDWKTSKGTDSVGVLIRCTNPLNRHLSIQEVAAQFCASSKWQSSWSSL